VRRLSTDERGLSQSVQYAVIFPALMLVTLGIVQAGVWIHGHNVALRAANAAVDIARGSYGTTAQAHDAAVDLARTGGLHDVEVSVSPRGSQVSVTVTARAPLLFEVGLGQIHETATAPVERVTPP